MTKGLRYVIAGVTIIAPALHAVSDIMEWIGGGFSRAQLIVNYAGFLPMPFMMIGLHALQRSKAGWTSLTGAVLYGIAFIYFTHTTLYALDGGFRDYETLWAHLGPVYTLHGGLMVAGGLLFGMAALRADVLWRPAVIIFIVGILCNLLLALLPLPDILQTIGSTFRNTGLICIGIRALYMNGGESSERR
jgi:hypothetical protein